LDRLEGVLAAIVREQGAPRLPPASQLPPVPGLVLPSERFIDDVRPPPAWLRPERVALVPGALVPEALAPEMTPAREGVGWSVILDAALCGLPLRYVAGITCSSPQPATSAQTATALAEP